MTKVNNEWAAVKADIGAAFQVVISLLIGGVVLILFLICVGMIFVFWPVFLPLSALLFWFMLVVGSDLVNAAHETVAENKRRFPPKVSEVTSETPVHWYVTLAIVVVAVLLKLAFEGV